MTSIVIALRPADERAFRGSPEPGADVIREVASMSAPVGRTPLPTKWSE
jgi:hypothetical protein